MLGNMKKVYSSSSNLMKNLRIRLVARRVIRDFINNTSIHGVKYLNDKSENSGPLVKLFWSFIFLSALIGSGMMLKVFWIRYQNNPMLTVVESFHIPSFFGTFPALTVCPIAQPSLESRSKMLRSLRLPENMSTDEAASLLKNTFELTHPRSELFEEHIRMNELLRYNGLEMVDFLKNLRGQCKDTVESCWWYNSVASCEKLFRVSHAYDGLCCSFNYKLEDLVDPPSTGDPTEGLIPTAGYGVHSGLTLVFKGNQFIMNHDNGTIARITTNSVGLILYIHHFLEYPNSFNRILQAGREVQLGIVARGKTREKGVSRRSEFPCVESNMRIKYFPSYDTTNCQNSCRIKIALHACGCVPWQFEPFIKREQAPICGFLQLKCIRENYRDIWSARYVNAKSTFCICPESCQGGEYIIKDTVIPIATKRFVPSMIYHNISEQNAVLRIFMAQQVFENMGCVSITNEIYLLSSAGGIFSLFLGCSILSICEIIYFFLILIFSCYSISRKST